MKRTLLSFITLLILLLPGLVKAQFTVVDTVRKTINGSDQAWSFINNTTPGNITLQWQVISTDFPAEWLTEAVFGICDNSVCRQNISGQLWNPTTNSGNTFTSAPYASGPGGGFDLSLDLSQITTLGCHYVTVKLTDISYARNTTFIICKAPTAVQNVSNPEEKTMLYPNPANSEINVVYDENADVKNIAIYNIIGKMMNVYKVAGNSANLNIESIPAGIYFLKLYNSKGNVVVTRKFTKQ